MTIDKYTINHPTHLIRLMTDGKSLKQVAAEFKVCMSTLKNWAHKYPEFTEAKAIGLLLAEAYWEDLGQKGIKGVLNKFNAPAWTYYMKCRFQEDWTESSQQKIELVDSVKKMTDDELNRTLQILLSAKNKSNPSGSSNVAQESV